MIKCFTVILSVLSMTYCANAETKRVNSSELPSLSYLGGIMRGTSIFDQTCGTEDDAFEMETLPFIEGLSFKSYSGRIGTLTSHCSRGLPDLKHIPQASLTLSLPQNNEIHCPNGAAAVGIQPYHDGGMQAYFSHFGLKCRKLSNFSNKSVEIYNVYGDRYSSENLHEISEGDVSLKNPMPEVSCPEGMVIIGLYGTYGTRLDSFGITCSDEPVKTFQTYPYLTAKSHFATNSSHEQEEAESNEDWGFHIDPSQQEVKEDDSYSANSNTHSTFFGLSSAKKSSSGEMFGSFMSVNTLIANRIGTQFFKNHGAIDLEGSPLKEDVVKNYVEDGKVFLHKIVTANEQPDLAASPDIAKSVVFALWYSAFAHGQDFEEGTFVLRDGGKVFDFFEKISSSRISSHLKSRKTSVHRGLDIPGLPKGMGTLLLIKFESYSSDSKKSEWLTFIKPEQHGTHGVVDGAKHLVDWMVRAPARLLDITDSEHGQRKERVPSTAKYAFESLVKPLVLADSLKNISNNAALFGYSYMVETLQKLQDKDFEARVAPESFVIVDDMSWNEQSTEIEREFTLEEQPSSSLLRNFLKQTLDRVSISQKDIEVRTGHEVIFDFRGAPKEFLDPYWLSCAWF